MRKRTASMARRITLAAAGTALALGLAGACGGEAKTDGRGAADQPEKQADAGVSTPPSRSSQSPRPSQPQPDVTGAGASGGRVLTQAELDQAILAAGDVAEFGVGPLDAPPPQGETADRPECLPLTALINGKPEPLAKAAAYRQLVGTKDGRPAVSEFLTTHGAQGASALLSRLRAAVTACADGFTATGGDGPSTYTDVKRLSAPEAGDDTLAYQVTGDFEGDPVPLVFHVVRVGGTVATFYTANFEDARTPQVPPVLLLTQAAKLT
ncbi:hypothetical protein ACFWM0_27840 [Streptomyces sp. NPDC058405]|uniref:hypothetical protein n=1 Tax=Streptomyces sp. NPDC058405 TaxID=3346482 RepID=UPI00364824F5